MPRGQVGVNSDELSILLPQKVSDGFKFSFLNNAHTCGLKEIGALFLGY